MSSSNQSFRRINVIQGDHAVSNNPDDVLTTLLGSCVATCIYDPVVNIGGMNHFLLPGTNQSSGYISQSYGLNAMELLINSLLKKGANRNRFEAKIFGGAKMIEGLSDIGQKNATFATEFLAFEGIPCTSKSLGGLVGRRLRFWPTSGKVQMKFMKPDDTIKLPIKEKAVPNTQVSSDLELF